MKRILTFAVLAASLLLAACENDEPETSTGKVRISLSATLAQPSRTLITDDGVNPVKSNWKQDDGIDLYFANADGSWTKPDATLTYDAATQKFTGEVTPGQYTAAYFVYPAGLPFASGSTTQLLFNPTPSGDYPVQSASAPTAHIRECMWGTQTTGLNITDNIELHVAMQRKSSVLKIKVEGKSFKRSATGQAYTTPPLDLTKATYTIPCLMIYGPSLYNTYLDIATGATENGTTSNHARKMQFSGYATFYDIDAIYLPIARDMTNLTEANTLSIQFSFAPDKNGDYTIFWQKTAKNFAENSWISLTLLAADGVYTEGGNELPIL